MEKLKAAVRSFRGLLYEKKEDGWEISKGRVTSWILLGIIIWRSGVPEPNMSVLYLFAGMWGASTGYNGFSKLKLAKGGK